MDRRTGKRGDGGFSLSDGTPGRKAPLSEEDGRRFAGSPAVPPPHPFLCSSPFLFLFRDFLDPPHPLSLSFLLSISPVIRRCPSLFFSMGRYDAITGENVKTVPHRRADLYNCRRPPSRRREPASGPSFVVVRFSSPVSLCSVRNRWTLSDNSRVCAAATAVHLPCSQSSPLPPPLSLPVIRISDAAIDVN